MTIQNRQTKPRICITSPLIYSLYNHKIDAPFGGFEVRLALIARELALRGNFEITIVAGDFGQPHREVIDGVEFVSWQGRRLWGVRKHFRVPSGQSETKPHSTLRPDSIAEWLRFYYQSLIIKLKEIKNRSKTMITLLNILHQTYDYFIHFLDLVKRFAIITKYHIYGLIEFLCGILRLPLPRTFIEKPRGLLGNYIVDYSQIAIYDEVDADLYIVPGNSYLSAEVAFYCKKRSKKYVFLAASDQDYREEYKTKKGKDTYGVPYSVKRYTIDNAFTHIVQSKHQQGILRDIFQRSSEIVKNPMDIQPLFPRHPFPSGILWVGKSNEKVKQPSVILKLAKELPQYSFTIVMNMRDLISFEKYAGMARALPNVKLIEKVPFHKIESYFAETRLLVNTSKFEGFPNTFLQAAKYGVPVVSLQVDPGGMISDHHTGIVCDGDFKKLKQSVIAMMEDDRLCAQAGRASRAYLEKNHDKNIIIPQYEEIFHQILKSPL